MTRIGIIGDVHGHAKELIDMIGALEEHGIDRLILLGDLVDRGPQSRYALRLACTWKFQARSGEKLYYEIVKGNHEDAYARVFRRQPKPGRQNITIPENSGLYRSFNRTDLQFMDSLPVAIEIEGMGYTCLHGGVEPRTTDLYDPWNLRTRYLSERTFESLPSVQSSDIWWGSMYDGRFGTIVCGHESHRKPTRYEHAIAIDGEGYRRVHGLVVSDEGDDPDVQAFTCEYGKETRKTDLVDEKDADRIHTWTKQDETAWMERSRRTERKSFERRYPSYPRFGPATQRSLDW